MKPRIKDLNAAITYQLEGMYDAEKKIQKAFSGFERRILSNNLRNVVRKYLESAADKRLKLKRIFSYLLQGPFDRKNEVVSEQLKNLKEWSRLIAYSSLRDKMVAASLHDLIQIKISAYSTAMILAEKVSLENVADLLEEITAWEKESVREITEIMISMNAKAIREPELTEI